MCFLPSSSHWICHSITCPSVTKLCDETLLFLYFSHSEPQVEAHFCVSSSPFGFGHTPLWDKSELHYSPEKASPIPYLLINTSNSVVTVTRMARSHSTKSWLFAVLAPRWWNVLPADIGTAKSRSSAASWKLICSDCILGIEKMKTNDLSLGSLL